MDLLTYTEAAELTGLASKTIQRHVKKGVLPVVETPVGKRIPRKALKPYLGLRKEKEDSTREVSQKPESPPGCPKDTQEETELPSSSFVPLSAHLASLDLARAQLESLQKLIDETHRSMLSAERAKLSLEVQLEQYQRVLTEQAESLAEERALRQAAEARVFEPRLAVTRWTRLKRWFSGSRRDAIVG